ncbi:MAG: Lrp/AsnC family transcriptional regulator [Pseudomonadota bacterium]
MKNIDHTDARILREIQRNADQPLERMGEKIGLSRNALWRRIKMMEEAGIIRGKVALVDAEALGLALMVFMQIKAPRHDAGWMSDFARAARSLPQVQSVFRMTGDLDYLIQARVRDMADYDRLYQRLIAQVPMGDVSASFVMEEIKATTEVPV